MKKINKLIKCIDISRYISNHLVGENHSLTHRKITGVFVMITGVLITKAVITIPDMTIHVVGDIVGYAIHGIGLIPFVSGLEGKGL